MHGEDPTRSVEGLDNELVEELDLLRDGINSADLREKHFAGGLSLFDFADGAWETASATLLVTREGRFAMAAIASARAALENGLQRVV